MSSYFLGHDGEAEFGTTSGVGCVTYSVGAQPETGERLVVYAQVFCTECPVGYAQGGWTPVAFFLQRETVTGAHADMAPGDPKFTQEMHQIFPSSLWYAAGSPPQSPSGITSEAASRAGC